MTARRQELALAESVVERVVVVGQHGVDGQAQNALQFLGGDVRPLRRAVQDHVQAVSKAGVDERLHGLLGLVQRRHFQRGDQEDVVDFIEHGDSGQIQRAAQVDHRPGVARPHKG